IARTDGVPLFVEELTKTVLEAGFLKDHGDRYGLEGPLPDLAIPTTLQDSLMARLDRLSPVKEVAQIGACIGREFSYELLAAVSPLGDNELRDALQQLIGGELIFSRGAPPKASYSFKHALVQDVAYQSLLKSRCQQFHKSIAQTLENHFPNLKETEPELIAHHCTEGGLSEQAVGYWRLAGERAADHFANIEAIGHLRNGLAVLDSLAGNSEHVAQELDLHLGLVASMRLLDRYEDALDELDRAEALASEHKRSAELARIHHNRGNIYFPLGNVEGCLAEHESARKFAREAGSPEDEAHALGGLGDAYYMRGRMLTAHDHFDHCIRLCRTHGFGGIEVAYLYMRATTYVYQIQFAEALDDCQAAIESAAKAGQPRAEIVSHLIAGEILVEQHDFDGAEEHARRGLEVARRLGARRFEPFLTEIIARARIIMGERAAALELLEDGLAISRDTGLSFIGPWILGVIAWASDDPEQRREALAEGVSILEKGCVGHNYYWFYRDAMEIALGEGSWDEVETHAAALEKYTSKEPAPWTEYFIARGRALARFGRNGPGRDVLADIDRLRDQAARLGVKTALPLLDAALSSVEAG
ncbi:MAG: tetratricopeptide repeat protein, partial [Alphaproteobacteria bacterium]|nr:tetratricopeptide repeat protein [Alphaproteobacteria bacterium]